MTADALKELRELSDGALRVVARYDRDGYEVTYVRSDLDVDLDTDRTEHIHESLVLDGMGAGYLEDLFAAGDLECTIHTFEERAVLHFAGEYAGLFVTVDALEFPLEAFVEQCRRYAEVAGQ